MRDHAQPARGRRGLLTIAAAVPLLVTATPASAMIDSAGPRCGTGSSSGNVNTCITIQGSGEHIDWIQATARVNNSARYIQICIHGPNGTIRCSPSASSYHYTNPGNQISVTWAPNLNEPGGDYCANTWRLDSNDGSNTEIGHECLNVHV